MPCASGSAESSIRAPTVAVPAALRTWRGPVWSGMTRLAGGSSASSSFAVGGGTGSAPGGSAPGSPNASRLVGSWCTGPSDGRVSTAWAVPISRPARSFGVRVKVSVSTAANASAATGRMIIATTSSERPLARRASRRAIRSAGRQPFTGHRPAAGSAAPRAGPVVR